MAERPLLLVSNDDGVLAPGLRSLVEALEPIGEVHCVAPTAEQSANSHSLTIHRPLRMRRISERTHAIDGTPADCIYVGLFHPGLLPRRPDIVVSGVNHGPNLGNDVHYSGTVAAAREGAIRDIRSIAFSQCGHGNMERAAKIAARLVSRLLDVERGSGQAPFLNVNFPEGEPRGIRATRLGRRTYTDEVLVRDDPRGRPYLWIGGTGAPHQKMDGSDTEAVDEGYVSVTPLSVEVTYPDHFGVAAWVAGPEDEESARDGAPGRGA